MPETTVQNTLTRPMASDTHDAPHAPEAAAAPVPPDKVVVVLDAALPPGQAANVAACLSAGLAGAWPAWAGRPLNDAAGLASVAIAHLPIAVLRADTPAMQALLARLPSAAGEGCVCLFPAYAQRVQDGTTYWALHAQAHHTNTPMLGVGLAGGRRWVNSLSGSLGLWR